MSAELAGKAYVEMSVKGQEQFSKAFTNMQASIRTFSARLASVGKGGLAGIGGVTNALGSMKSMLTGVVGKIGAAGAALGLASANLDTQLAGIATDIDNITVDNAAIADAVWDEAMSGHTSNGTYGAHFVRSANHNQNTVQITGSGLLKSIS